MQQSRIESFQYLSNFNSLKDFNNNIEAFLSIHKKDFTVSELLCFKQLCRFGVKVFGVANVSINTLLKAIGERNNGVSVSESTFHRMKRKAIKLGILTVKVTERKNGSQSSNLWIFNRFLNTNDTPNNSENLSNKESSESVLAPQENHQKSKTSNQIKERNQPLNSDFVSNRVPKVFTNYVQYFYNDAQTIEEFYKVVSIQTRYLSYYTKNDKVELALNAFKQLVRNLKKGRKVKNIFGYYWGIVNRMLDQEYFELISEGA
jgi:hypothetical protein